MLSEEQTSQYIRLAKAGDASAKEALLEGNVSLLKSIVRRYLGKGVEFDDLFQLAGIGLLKAVYGFDESYGVRFSTYAVPMIAGEIKRFMRDDGSVKVSRAMKATARELNRYIEEQTEYRDERSQTLAERLPAVDNQEEMIERMQLRSAIEKLPAREKKIIMLRYFRDMTQSEVAKVVGVSQVQISRIESRVVAEMKKSLG